MKRLLLISANSYPALEKEHTTKKIWRELAKGFEEYHILARAQDNRFHSYKEDNIYLHLVPSLYNSRSFAISSFYMIKLLKKNSIDIVLCQCPILGGFTANFLKKKYRYQVYQEIHDTYYFELCKSKRIFDRILYKITKYSFSKATKIRVLNNMMKEMVMEKFPELEPKISIVENRVDMTKFKSKKQNNKLHYPVSVVSIGSFVHRKGYHTAIEVVKELLTEGYNISLTLIGGGAEKENLIFLSNGYNEIKLYDRLPQEELVKILLEADIYIQPSLREGMPRAILEAMAMKLPIIASNVSTIPGTIYDHINGLLVEPENSQQLKNAIIELINNEMLREKLVDKAYKDILERFEWNNAFERYRIEILSVTQ